MIVLHNTPHPAQEVTQNAFTQIYIIFQTLMLFLPEQNPDRASIFFRTAYDIGEKSRIVLTNCHRFTSFVQMSVNKKNRKFF